MKLSLHLMSVRLAWKSAARLFRTISGCYCRVMSTNFFSSKVCDNAQQCFAYTAKANFPAHILNFNWRWWNRIESRLPFKIFSTLIDMRKLWSDTYELPSSLKSNDIIFIFSLSINAILELHRMWTKNVFLEAKCPPSTSSMRPSALIKFVQCTAWDQDTKWVIFRQFIPIYNTIESFHSWKSQIL